MRDRQMGEGIDRAVGGGRYMVGSWIHRIDQRMEGGWVDGGGCVVIG